MAQLTSRSIRGRAQRVAGRLGRLTIGRRSGAFVAVVVVLTVVPLALLTVFDRESGPEPADAPQVGPAPAGQPGAPIQGGQPTPGSEATIQLATEALVRPSEAPPIVYSRLRRDTYELFGTTPSGGEPVRISDRLANFPAWSADGRRLAFVSEVVGLRGSRPGLVVIEPTGSIREVMGGPQVPASPSFSRATREILYQATLASGTNQAGAVIGPASIDAVSDQGGGRRTLVDADGAAYQPASSPSGDRVAAIIGEPGCDQDLCPQRLSIYDLKGKNEQPLITDGAAGQPAWSPDGKQIAFTWDQGDGPAIWTIGVDDRELAQITSGHPTDAEPTWSPDGRSLAFSRDCDIFVVSSSGGRPRNITDSSACEISPTWNPQS